MHDADAAGIYEYPGFTMYRRPDGLMSSQVFFVVVAANLPLLLERQSATNFRWPSASSS
jgi:hypothetical protein